MLNYRNIIQKLEKFGLSESQALIYLTLVQHGELRIQDIANKTQVPRSSVYEGLKTLAKVGLIEKVIDHKFVRIKPYPIGALRHGLNEKLLQFQRLMNDLIDLEKTITLLPDTASLSETRVRYYRGTSAGQQLLWNSLDAKSPIYVYSVYGRSKFVGKKFYKDFVKESQERDLREMVLINPTPRAINLIKKDTGSSVARTKIEDIRFLEESDLLIKGETFIYDNIYAQINLSKTGINGFEIESHAFAEMQKSIFETLWNIAKPLSNKVE